MEFNKKIACIILNYNDSSTTISMVNRIKEYAVFDYIVVVDNSSTDNSFYRITNNFKKYNKIKIIRTRKNKGYGDGNNFGIKYAYKKLNVEYAVVSNPDVNFSDEMVENLLKLLISKKVAMVSGVQRINGKVIADKAWKIPTAKAWTLVETKIFHKIMWNKYHYKESYFCSSYSYVDCVPGAMYLINIRDFLLVKGFDEDIFLFGEEVVLGWKLKRANKRILLANHKYYDHQHSVSINKAFNSKIKQLKILHKSKLFYYKKYLKLNKPKLMMANLVFKLVVLRKIIMMFIKRSK